MQNGFFGTKLTPFRLGQTINNFHRTSRFVPESAAIKFGDLVKYGTAMDTFETMTGAEVSDAVFAGIAIATKAEVSSTYPGSASEIQVGQAGDLLIEGDIIVKFTTTAGDALTNVSAGKKVYLDPDTGLVTTLASHGSAPVVNHIELTALRFTGHAEVVDGVKLVGVRKRIF